MRSIWHWVGVPVAIFVQGERLLFRCLQACHSFLCCEQLALCPLAPAGSFRSLLPSLFKLSCELCTGQPGAGKLLLQHLSTAEVVGTVLRTVSQDSS